MTANQRRAALTQLCMWGCGSEGSSGSCKTERVERVHLAVPVLVRPCRDQHQSFRFRTEVGLTPTVLALSVAPGAHHLLMASVSSGVWATARAESHGPNNTCGAAQFCVFMCLFQPPLLVKVIKASRRKGNFFSWIILNNTFQKLVSIQCVK